MLSGNAKLHIIVHALQESAERPENAHTSPRFGF
jgi:hypothetical protein